MSERDALTDATAAVRNLVRNRSLSDAPTYEEMARAALEAAGVMLSADQPRPRLDNHFPSCHDLLDHSFAWIGEQLTGENAEALAVLRAWNADRRKIGEVKYGTLLQPFNGRKPIVDAILEALDFLVYMEQRCYEQLAAGISCAPEREMQAEAMRACVSLARMGLSEDSIEVPR